MSYGLNFLVGGTDAFGYHLTDILIHWGVTLGVFVLGLQLTRQVLSAGLAAILFALNPLLPPTVMNIAQRHDTLMTLGTVWALALFYVACHANGLKRSLALVASWVAFFIAVGAKETGLFDLALILWFVWRYRGAFEGRYSLFVQSLPFVCIAALYFVARQLVLTRLVSPFNQTWNIQLPFEYFQEILLPRLNNSAWGWLTLALVLIAIISLARPNLRDREFLTWLVLFGLWIGIPLTLYLAVGTPLFRNRYAYAIIPPVVLLLVRLLTVPLIQTDTRWATLVQIVAKLVVIVTLVAWLPWFGIPFFPRGLIERENVASSYLHELDRVVADLPANTDLQLTNVPKKFVHRDGLQMWLDLKWQSKGLTVVSLKKAKSARGRVFLSVTEQADHAVVNATFVPLPN